jgi:hypothetical protein
MKVLTAIQGLSASLLLFVFTTSSLMAAPPCKGPNKNDPGCPGAEDPPPPPESLLAANMVDSVTVDWLNLVLVVRGTGIDAATDWFLGGSPSLSNVTVIDANTVEIGFDADLAAEVQGAGSHLLTADGNVQLTVYSEYQIIDPAATVCPCQVTWSAQIPDWGGPIDTVCLEVEGLVTNDPADISGTYTPADPLLDPQYAFGASFYPGEPGNSVCRLVQINPDLSTADLVNLPINENQQANCRTALADHACSTITTLP